MTLVSHYFASFNFDAYADYHRDSKPCTNRTGMDVNRTATLSGELMTEACGVDEGDKT